MSGGSHDYACLKVSSMAEDFGDLHDQEIDVGAASMSIEDRRWHIHEQVLSKHPLRVALARFLQDELAPVLRSIEWSDSGDNSPDAWIWETMEFLDEYGIDYDRSFRDTFAALLKEQCLDDDEAFAEKHIALRCGRGNELLSMSEAARRLNVERRQVFRYVERGLLPAAKRGDVWAIPETHVVAFGEHKPRDGRPLSQETAWELIAAGHVDLSNYHRYTYRGKITRWSGKISLVDGVVADERVVVSGMHAAYAYGVRKDPEACEVQVYVAGDPDEVVDGLTPDPLGTVIVRSVSEAVWPVVLAASSTADEFGGFWLPHTAKCAPVTAIALDLVLSPHSQEREIAKLLMEVV